MDLTAKQAQFVREYLIDLNATQAAIRAGYSAATAEAAGSRLLRDVKVGAAVEAAMEKRAARTEITQDRVLKELWSIATADPNELIEYRRRCCRHCWGKGFRYQETPGERERRLADWEANKLAAPEPLKERWSEFDERGGIGFNATREPNPDCPECFGEGVGDALVKDTGRLSPETSKLYAGVKITREGIEVKMHDKAAALVNVGKHLGMFKERHEHGGLDDGPIQHSVSVKFVKA